VLSCPFQHGTPAHWLAGSLSLWLIGSLAYWLIGSLSHLLCFSLFHLFACSLAHFYFFDYIYFSLFLGRYRTNNEVEESIKAQHAHTRGPQSEQGSLLLLSIN
jgi:hypothetical protein